MSELLNVLTLDNLKQTTGLMRESPLSISRWIKMPFRWLWGSGRYKAIWKVRLMLDSDYESRVMRLVKACAYPSIGGSRGGARGGPPPPSLFLDQTLVRRVEKKFLDTGLPAYLRVWMTRGPLLISRSGSGSAKGILSSMRMSRSSISKSSLHGL